jgi:hypothetical protein
MMLLNSRYCFLLAAVAGVTGCGKQERIEAVQFAKTLTEQKANFTSANTIEKELVSNARVWCGDIMANGAGRGAALDQNAAVAGELAKTAVAISSQLSQLRHAIDGQPLKEEYPRQVRDELTTQLTKRQRLLQDLRAWLEQSAPRFLEYKQVKTYVGDTYPDGIDKLNALLGAYKPPDDALGAALTALQSKYRLSDSEI